MLESQSPATEAQGILSELTSLQDANPRDLTQQQITRVRDYLAGDLFAFAWFIFDFTDLSPDLHGELAALIGRWATPDLRRLMIQIPRNFLKTSLCTIANSLWQICREPDEPVAIFNEKQDNAAMWVRTIRDTTMSNPLFQVLWRDLMPPGKAGPEDSRTTPRWWKWNDDEIMFQRSRVQPESSISALGIGSASAGRHWPKIIMDDLISEDAAGSPTIMTTTKQWIDTAIYLERPALQGNVLVACTPWAYDDTYAYMLRKYDYQLYKRSALEDQDGNEDVLGESIYPQKFPTPELTRHYKRDDFGFMAQMQCNPRPGRDRSFDPKWLRWGRVTGDPEHPFFAIRTEDYDSTIVGDVLVTSRPPPRVPLAIMSKALLLDPAPTEESQIRRERSARNGLVVAAKDPWGRRYVLDCWASRADPLDVVDQIFRMMDKWGTHTIGIEEVNFSKLYRWWLLQRAQQRGQMIQVIKLLPGKRDKDTRITSLIPAVRSGLYYLNLDAAEPLAKEMAEYPHTSTVDLIDALAYDDKIPRPETDEEAEDRIMSQYVDDLGANPVCGY